MEVVSKPSASPVQQHKSVPRWLRMGIRIAMLVGLVSLPALAMKEPAFEALHKYKAFSVLFLVVGTIALPMWEPHLGIVVLTFTLLLPVGLVAIWLTYGLFLGCSNIIFMMGACVVVTFITFFVAEMLNLPIALLGVFATIFVALANMFITTPGMAYMVSGLLSVGLIVSAVIATLVSWLVFPEFCVDEVIMSHREGLEHLLHLAHHAFGSRPPALARYAVGSTKSAYFGATAKWQHLFAAADEQPATASEMSYDRKDSAVAGNSDRQSKDLQDTCGAGLDVGRVGCEKSCAGPITGKETGAAIRSLLRMNRAFEAGVKAQLGAKAEVVLAAFAHKRIIVPCTPLIPCSGGQLDNKALLALRHIAVSTGLDVYKIHNATQPLSDTTAQMLSDLTASAEWSSIRSALLGALQDVVDTFPLDYYPVKCRADKGKLQDYRDAVQKLEAVWRERKHAAAYVDKQAQQQQPSAAAAAAGAIQQPTRSSETAEHVVRVSAGACEREMQIMGLQEPLLLNEGPAAEALGYVHVMLIVRMLQDLADRLEQLYTATSMASDSILRFRCC